MRAVLDAFRTAWVLTWRFVTRMFLDEAGDPSIAQVMATAVTVWYCWWITRMHGGIGPLYRPAEPYVMQAVTAIVALWIVYSAAVKMGAGLFVPVAELLASAVGGVVKAGRVATEVVLERMRTDYEPPDRTVPVGEAELARPGLKRANLVRQKSLGGDDPYRDDETGEGP